MYYVAILSCTNFFLCSMDFFRTVYYGEYKNYGPGARSYDRVEWSHNLTTKEAKEYLTLNIIGGRSWIKSANIHYKKISVIISNHVNPIIP